MNIRWKVLVFGFLFVLASCLPASGLNMVSPTPEPEKGLTTPASPTASITPSQTLAATTFLATTATPTPTPIATITPTELPSTVGFPTSLSSLPMFFYIQDGAVMMQAGDQVGVKIGEAGDLGELKNAFFLDNKVYLVRDQVIQRIDLSSFKNDILLDLGAPALSSWFFPSTDHTRILYAIYVYDETGWVNTTDRGGFIDLTAGSIYPFHNVRFVAENFAVLPVGLSTDNQVFYGLPLGGDPSLASLWIMNAYNGSLFKEVPVSGYGPADLSPNRRFLATTQLWIKDRSGMDVQNMVRLYDLSAGQMPFYDYPIPLPPNSVSDFLWSPDSLKIYLQPRDVNTDQPIGIWELDLANRFFIRIAYFANPPLYPVSISPDGGWMILRGFENDPDTGVRLLNLSTLQVFTFSLPSTAKFAGWQKP